MSVGRVFRSGFLLFAGTSFSSILNYLYWLLVSYFVNPAVLGVAAAVLSLESILAMVSSMGIPAGLQRFVGRAAYHDDDKSLTSYLGTSLVSSILMNSFVMLLLSLLAASGAGFFVDSQSLAYVVLLMLVSFWNPILNSLFISTLRTDICAAGLAVSSIAKMIAGFFFLNLNPSVLAIVLGVAVSSLVLDFVLLFHAARFIHGVRGSPIFSATQFRELLEAGSAAWVPRVLKTAGEGIGVLLIFGLASSGETGLFFVALAIGSILQALPSSLLGVMFPYLSGRSEGREHQSAVVIRLATALTVPLAITLLVYSDVPFSLLGADYSGSAVMLAILALGAITVPLQSGYVSYAYAKGSYRTVGVISSITSVSSVILYCALVVPFGGVGAAISYSIGEVLGFLATVVSAKRIGFPTDLLGFVKSVVPPLLIGLPLYLLGVHWVLGTPLLLGLSLIAYGRFGVLVKSEVRDVAEAFLSQQRLGKVYTYVRPAIGLVFGTDEP